jgi:quercetin dioxygenase-like cupin family protein
METETLDPTLSLSSGYSVYDALLPASNLPKIIENLKNANAKVRKKQLNSMILLKKPDKQVVITTLKRGVEIESFQSNNSVTFQIIQGKMKFRTYKESVTLERGQVLTLHENTRYCLAAIDESVLLLTVSTMTFEPSQN